MNSSAPDSLILSKSNIASNCFFEIGRFCKISSLQGSGILQLQAYSKEAVIILNNIDLDQLKFPLYGLNLIVDKNQPYALKMKLYDQIIKRYSNVPETRRKYDVQRIQLMNNEGRHWFINFIQKNWDYYGYDKTLIFINAFF
ncbi:hypothetical protein CLV51_1021148 [Chitinophaga niastensis]|uniref:Uncharacterized protein n=1 Tax=Chitinophaga niastensis TaxID=536980 RepID=A0A2P8HPY9_CHINA|nr:hypothetical protein [Chitinophaga niastensis]PSL48281.1 hypothetical protein CLV51_1021148 [Chitinophaga niastensis]